jgi:hypothetical protein
MGSVAGQVAQHAHCPVLGVGAALYAVPTSGSEARRASQSQPALGRGTLVTCLPKDPHAQALRP